MEWFRERCAQLDVALRRRSRSCGARPVGPRGLAGPEVGPRAAGDLRAAARRRRGDARGSARRGRRLLGICRGRLVAHSLRARAPSREPQTKRGGNVARAVVRVVVVVAGRGARRPCGGARRGQDRGEDAGAVRRGTSAASWAIWGARRRRRAWRTQSRSSATAGDHAEACGEIIDLAEGKIYELDVKKRTYEVTTFEERRKRIEAKRRRREESRGGLRRRRQAGRAGSAERRRSGTSLI